ncbi:TetR/AcrR family transcriptional regulator [Sinanaerobacter sp. ZZT-01]|uniref:TetR/AcrR family transcriptional regulator n=1 Tax=Sinanaerobacter sp. ZZT-01 TaxID=3111540 RepID=UPI002D783690|nr:TetR/AcrR family transcriptional regulator [Sinanaerobacter sp. ZZT-01]WRR92954.1 TetR/AcrR family transcriptional regulator [Sinanaerobacter sp. ZZT-01]
MDTERFDHIDLQNEKVLRIVNCGFEVFAKNSFEKASTNLIVENAEISRGLLYHYFRNKKELFEFLLYFSGKKIISNMVDSVDWSNTDFLLRVRQALISKIETLAEYPYLYEFCDKYARDYAEELAQKLMPDISSRLFKENLDFSQLRKEVDVELMKSTIVNALSKLITKILKDGTGLSKTDIVLRETAEIDRYLEFFRTVFYM